MNKHIPTREGLNPAWLAFFRALSRASAKLDALEAATEPAPMHDTDSPATAQG